MTHLTALRLRAGSASASRLQFEGRHGGSISFSFSQAMTRIRRPKCLAFEPGAPRLRVTGCVALRGTLRPESYSGDLFAGPDGM